MGNGDSTAKAAYAAQVAGGPGAPPPKPAEPDLKEVEALAASLNNSAERLQALWFTFLTLTLYFALSTGTTTHRMLFLEEGLSLPLVNVKLPLLGFYFLAPLTYVVLHAYMLMMLVLLARTAKTFLRALVTALPGHANRAARERFRMRLENALFLQIIIGGRRERAGGNGRVLRAIALLSLAVAPVALMLMFQLMFLPYHHDWLTWWHRGLVLVDLGLVWTLWPAYRRRWGERLAPRIGSFFRVLGRALRRLSHFLAFGLRALRPPPSGPLGGPDDRRYFSSAEFLAAFSRLSMRTSPKMFLWRRLGWLRILGTALVLIFSFAMATYPGEGCHGNPVAAAIDRAGQGLIRLFGYRIPNGDEEAERRLAKQDKDRTIARFDGGRLSAFLFGYGMPIESSKLNPDQRGWLPNRFWLPDESFVDKEKLEKAAADTARGSDTRYVASPSLKYRDLVGAVLVRADLQNLDFLGARAAKATFEDARLQKSRFQVLKSAGVLLSRAQFQGASLDGAELQGASLVRAQLQGASLVHAQLQGALLGWAQLQGASLFLAQLQGAWLIGAQLQGAALDGAHLQGAALNWAQLQGASLDGAQLQGAAFDGAEVWRVRRPPPARVELTELRLLRHAPVHVEKSAFFVADPSRGFRQLFDFQAWRKSITDQIPEGERRAFAHEQLEILAPTPEPMKDVLDSTYWAARQAEQPTGGAFAKQYAEFVERLACSGDNALHIARGLLRSGRLRAFGAHLPAIAAKMRKSRPNAKEFNAAACPGVAGFTEADWARLDELVKDSLRQMTVTGQTAGGP